MHGFELSLQSSKHLLLLLPVRKGEQINSRFNISEGSREDDCMVVVSYGEYVYAYLWVELLVGRRLKMSLQE